MPPECQNVFHSVLINLLELSEPPLSEGSSEKGVCSEAMTVSTNTRKPAYSQQRPPTMTQVFSDPKAPSYDRSKPGRNRHSGRSLHSYGADVSLDPASLSEIPDPVAIAEIQRMYPKIQMSREDPNINERVEAAIRNAYQPASERAQEQADAAAMHQAMHFIANSPTTEQATGDDFDRLLTELADSGLVQSLAELLEEFPDK